MKPLHAIAEVPVLPVPTMPAGAGDYRPAAPRSRRAEIQNAWSAEARLVLGLDDDEEVPARHRWLCNVNGDGTGWDERNLAELGRWAQQLGRSHCRRAAEIAAQRYREAQARKDARRQVVRSLRELRLFLTARDRRLKRRRRETLLAQLAQVIDLYRAAHPERPQAEIGAAVRELLAGLEAGRKVAC